jgi:hypothetical protein
VLFLKSLIFLIESILILFIFRKIQKKLEKSKFAKKEVEGPIGDLATYLPINKSFQHFHKEGGNFEQLRGITKKP